MQSKDQRRGKSAFDPSEVKVDGGLLSNLSQSHKLIDTVILSTEQTIERNKVFIDEFVARYE